MAAGAAALSEIDRATAMGERLRASLGSAGIPADGAALVLGAYRLALQPRRTALSDAHDTRMLHPARTVLILLDDAGVRAPATLAAGALTESAHPALRVPLATISAQCGSAVATLVERVPIPELVPDAERLLEELVVSPVDVRLVAVAERLDYARHLHLDPAAPWASEHSRTCAVYAPVAGRTHAFLHKRYARWCGAFERRFLADSAAGNR